MLRNSLSFCVVLATLGSLGACAEDIDSEDVLTSGVYADIAVRDRPDGTVATVEVSLRAGGAGSNTFLELVGDDTLVALHDGESKELTHRTEPAFDFEDDNHHYQATFDIAPGDTDFVVSFERTVDDGAPETLLSLPAPFEIGVDALDDGSYSRSTDDLVVTWTNPDGDPMKIAVSGPDCIEDFEQGVDGREGAFVVPAGVLKDTSTLEVCELTVSLVRAHVGDLDPNYGEGGVAEGQRARSVTVPSLR